MGLFPEDVQCGLAVNSDPNLFLRVLFSFWMVKKKKAVDCSETKSDISGSNKSAVGWVCDCYFWSRIYSFPIKKMVDLSLVTVSGEIIIFH